MNPGDDTEAVDHCHTCGKPLGADDRFCGTCGAVRISRSPTTIAERKETGLIPRRWPIGVIVGVVLAVAGIGAGIVLVVSGNSGSTKHVALAPLAASSSLTGNAPSSGQTSPGGEEAPSTAPEEAGTDTGTTPSKASPNPVTPLTVVDSYWADIRGHNFAGAYAYIVPGSLELSESQFIASERASRILTVQFHGNLASSSESTATVDVVSLITRDAQFGCRSWTGSYDMTSGGSGWQIARANLSPRRCSR
jgi:hypothetical protein